MVQDGLVTEIGLGRYAITFAVKVPPGKTYEIMVEKICPGSAIVTVDDRVMARLNPEDFNGPKDLIKKSSRFTAIGELYTMEGVQCLRVRHVIRSGNQNGNR